MEFQIWDQRNPDAKPYFMEKFFKRCVVQHIACNNRHSICHPGSCNASISRTRGKDALGITQKEEIEQSNPVWCYSYPSPSARKLRIKMYDWISWNPEKHSPFSLIEVLLLKIKF
ncbi:hypothetical protein AVEN_13966-1 [Araneus ventricosus]|uniref:Uncharacterized protein n=1 Tax=Araneus ventricosus TaxID=182803 RepID=A0A4Y2K261_ARAVE|nr:hypothetical protein AVEN_13966-1 [Araneus ventricosus]